MSTDRITPSLEKTIVLLRSHVLLIAICTTVVTGSAFLFSTLQTKQYTATAKLLFRNPGLDQQASGVAAVGSSDPQRDTETNVRLVRLESVANRAARMLGRTGVSAAAVLGSVEVSADGTSDIASVSATNTDPKRAARVANAFAASFIAIRREVDQQRIDRARALVQRQIVDLPPAQKTSLQGQALVDRSESLRILRGLQTGNAELVERATPPTSPSSPKVVRNTVLAGMLGLMLGICLAFLIDRLDRRVREPGDFETLYGIPLLGVVPESQAYPAANTAHIGALPERESEAFSMLRAHLRYFDVDRDVRTVLVTSGAPGEGKSTVAQYLARAAALMGTTTLLLEADLRRPSLAPRLGLDLAAGLGEVLIGAMDVEDAIISIEVSRAATGASSKPRLDVLPAGPVPPNPAQLIESHAMEELLAWAAQQYELVIIDSPPLTVVSDAVSLVRKVDGVMIVGRIGLSRTDDALRMRERLTALGAPLLGVVANGYAEHSAGYGYGYDSADAPKASEVTTESSRPSVT